MRKFLEINERTFFVLIEVNDAASVSYDTVNFFGLVKELYIFWSISTKNCLFSRTQVPQLKLKVVQSYTRRPNQL